MKIQSANRIIEEGPQSFFFGFPFVVGAIICFITPSLLQKNKKKKKVSQSKKILFYLSGTVLALIGIFLMTPFFYYLSVRHL